MIKTKALEKLTQFLKSKKIKEINFELKDNQGHFVTHWHGAKYEIRLCHDSSQVRVVKTEVKYL